MRTLALILSLTATATTFASNSSHLQSTPNEPTSLQEVHEFAQRARQTIQTFSDTKGRQLIAEIIEVKTDSLKIGRQADRRVMQLPVEMLCTKDKAFAAYLWKQKTRQQSNAADTELHMTKRADTITSLNSVEGLNTTVAPSSSVADQVWANLF